MAHLLITAASEADVMLKMLCSPFNPTASTENDYRHCLPHQLNDFCSMKVFISRYTLEFSPWSSWQSNNTPGWWSAYNKVKHHRDKHYEKANLGNVLNSMAGLLLCNLYYYKKLANIGNLSPWPLLFDLDAKYEKGVTPADGGWTLICKIP